MLNAFLEVMRVHGLGEFEVWRKRRRDLLREAAAPGWGYRDFSGVSGLWAWFRSGFRAALRKSLWGVGGTPVDGDRLVSAGRCEEVWCEDEEVWFGYW